MTNIERRLEIDNLNKQIEEALKPNIFILNNTIIDLQKEIWELQNQCEHNFINGFCEYCYKAEE